MSAAQGFPLILGLARQGGGREGASFPIAAHTAPSEPAGAPLPSTKTMIPLLTVSQSDTVGGGPPASPSAPSGHRAPRVTLKSGNSRPREQKGSVLLHIMGKMAWIADSLLLKGDIKGHRIQLLTGGQNPAVKFQ